MRAILKRSSIWRSESWHIRPASNRRPSSLIFGSLRPLVAVRLLRNAAWHCLGAPSVPAEFQSFLLDHALRFILADELLVNSPPPPKVAPTSCTSMTDLSQVTEGGLAVSSICTL